MNNVYLNKYNLMKYNEKVTLEKKEEIVLTDVTIDLLDRFENYKNKIEEYKPRGDKYIIKGILILSEIVKEVNPECIDEEVALNIKDKVECVLSNLEYNMQKINLYVHLGVNNSLMILWNMIDCKNLKKVRKV